MIYFLDFKASYTIYMIQNESRVSKLCSWSFKTMWGGNYPTLLETQNFMTPCYFGAPKKKTVKVELPVLNLHSLYYTLLLKFFLSFSLNSIIIKLSFVTGEESVVGSCGSLPFIFDLIVTIPFLLSNWLFNIIMP